MSVPAAATEKQVQCTGTRPHAPARTPQPALTPDSDGGTTRPVYRTTPAPHPAMYAARACICLRHAPRAPPWPRHAPPAPPLRAAPRGVSLSSPVPAHISVCLSPLPVRGTGSAPAAAGVTGTGLVSTRGRPAHHVPIYTKKKDWPYHWRAACLSWACVSRGVVASSPRTPGVALSGGWIVPLRLRPPERIAWRNEGDRDAEAAAGESSGCMHAQRAGAGRCSRFRRNACMIVDSRV